MEHDISKHSVEELDIWIHSPNEHDISKHSLNEHDTVCPQKIWSLGIDTIFDAIFYEDLIKNKFYNC